MKKIRTIITSLAFVIGLVGAFTPATAGAINVFNPDTKTNPQSVCATQPGNDICKASKTDKLQTYIVPIINIVLYILEAIAVIVIIIAGFMYVVSNGDPSTVKKAKDTILYAVIGLIVAIMAYAIINFVVVHVKTS